MTKFNYFEALEVLADLAVMAVGCACIDHTPKKALSEIRYECDRTLYSLEESLFAEFLPPLERDNIAAYAHCLSRVVDSAAEHIALCCLNGTAKRKTQEEKICYELAQKIKENTYILRTLKKSGELPSIEDFRNQTRSAFEAHRKDLSLIRSGAVPKSLAHNVISAGRIRTELSRCFDELLEIMLNNI
jgi:hypothetical protein